MLISPYPALWLAGPHRSSAINRELRIAALSVSRPLQSNTFGTMLLWLRKGIIEVTLPLVVAHIELRNRLPISNFFFVCDFFV
jgi:hypothetical protein